MKYNVLKIENTYDWIIATEISKINSIFWIINMNGIIKIKFLIEFPNKDSNRWPASILAVNRIASVHGRIIFLIDSINTIKFINTVGVFIGTKWINILLVLIDQP